MDKKLFDDDDSGEEVAFREKSDYAKKYNSLRRKEELLKLKNKYGEDINNSSDSSSSEDDDDVVFSEQFEKDFFKTLSCLKNKDPRIYNKDVRFFNNEEVESFTTSQKKKEKPMTIRDYNREIILNKEEANDDDDDEDQRPVSPSYVEEEKKLKNEFRKVLNDDSDDDGNELAGLFSKRNKTKAEEDEEEESYREWLAGQSKHLKNDSEEQELKPLKDFWSNPLLDKDEAFLKDYVLNQRFIDKTSSKKIPTYDEIIKESDEDISEDERLVGQQAEFEHKFNFRFEEPDQDFIKRYPRTLEHSMRHKDDKRSKKRAETRDRKAEEKQRKKEEISQLKSLKLKEIQEKILKLKEITGNDQLAFDPEDIEGDFDPDAHDRKMQQLFDEEYYGEDADAKKPEFPDLDEELGIENWDTWDVEETNDNAKHEEPHCEDEDFNMDCDYDPNAVKKKSLLENLKETVEGTSKRKRKRKNKLADALSIEKPTFDPEKFKKTFSQYLEEYYKLDCEDVIGDMPCRFKYREVPACDYGLTMEEILLADDKELNRWYPLKKTLQYRPEHVEKNEQKLYSKKAKDENLKRKILPSLFKMQEEDENDDNNQSNQNVESSVTPSKKKKNKKKKKSKEQMQEQNGTVEQIKDAEDKINSNENKEEIKTSIEKNNTPTEVLTKSAKKRKRRARKNSMKNEIGNGLVEISNSPKIKKQKLESKNPTYSDISVQDNSQLEKSKKKKKSHSEDSNARPNNKSKNEVKTIETVISNNTNKNDDSVVKINKKRDKLKRKKLIGNKHNKNVNIDKNSIKITDERLKAYGLNPKKYKDFMKFKKY